MPMGTAVGSVLVLACLAAGCGGSPTAGEAKSGPAEPDALSAFFEVPSDALANLSLQVVEAGPRRLSAQAQYPATVGFRAPDRASIVAQVDGVLQAVDVQLGSKVALGDRLAVMTSRDLARARSVYLDGVHRLEFAETLATTEADLWEKGMTSRDAFKTAQHALAEAKLELQTAAQELLSLGVRQAEIQVLQANADPHGDREPEPLLNRLELRATLAGEVVGLHGTTGQAVAAGDALFEVANLERVWVDARVPAKDLPYLGLGTMVSVHWSEGGLQAEGPVVYVGPEVESSNQTALVRVELPNPTGRWRPGLFVVVAAEQNPQRVPVAVPETALVYHGTEPNQAVVFVQTSPGA
ncbi:MAG TPA: efflux RND transporter periplasmic adaptor subunit, partial [Planctomycetota bacterium]|nr:efflux RND transporter periplasmic adaptor subunit [Planctomycetota bacterium]